MKFSKFILFFIFLILSCEKNQMYIEILESNIIRDVPSASGIVKSGNLFYVIGDDSPFLFALNENDEILAKSAIYSTDDLQVQRIRKEIKPDFEALEMINENELVAFGSGSKTPERDIFLRIILGDSLNVRTYNISSFYNNLRELEILENEELNIEAIAFQNNQILLFNRGKNIIFNFNYQDLMAYFDGLKSFPKPKITLFDLPKIKGIEAGFSGATFMEEEPTIIFTASVENTNDAYNDGEILGSFVGVLKMINNELSSSYFSTIIPQIETPLKVESVVVEDEINSNEAYVVFVTDSDGGNSMKLDCKIGW